MNFFVALPAYITVGLMIVSWTTYVTSTINSSISLLEQSKQKEDFIYKCAQIKATIKNIEDATLYLQSKFKDHAQKIAQKSQNIIATLQQRLPLQPCSLVFKKSLLIAYPHKQKNPNIHEHWPNWVVHYKQVFP